MAANLPAVKDPFAKPKSPYSFPDSKRPGLLSQPAPTPKDTGGPIAISPKPTAKNSAPPTPAPQPVAPAAPAAPTGDSNADAFKGIAPPGLTPDQAAAFNTAWNNYQGSLNTDNASLAQAPITEAQTIANDKATFVQNSETAQAGAAARGMFNSSIKDGALNDIQATQTNNDLLAAGQLSTLTTSINADIARLTGNWGATAIGAVGDAVINGQGVTPTTGGTPAPAPAPAAAPNPNTVAAGIAYGKAVAANPASWRTMAPFGQSPAASNAASEQAATNAQNKANNVNIAQQKATVKQKSQGK